MLLLRPRGSQHNSARRARRTAATRLRAPHYPTRIRRTPPVLVKAGLTSKRGWRQVENDEYAAFVRRILRAYARRVGNGDVEALIPLADLADEIDTAIAEAVKGLRAFGYSWAEIGARLGVTRQAAQQRWGSF